MRYYPIHRGGGDRRTETSRELDDNMRFTELRRTKRIHQDLNSDLLNLELMADKIRGLLLESDMSADDCVRFVASCFSVDDEPDLSHVFWVALRCIALDRWPLNGARAIGTNETGSNEFVRRRSVSWIREQLGPYLQEQSLRMSDLSIEDFQHEFDDHGHLIYYHGWEF